MNNSFRYKFNIWNYVTVAFLSIGVIPLSVINLLRLFEVGKFTSYHMGLEIISISVSLLILAFVVTILIIARYTVTDDTLIVQIVTRIKIPLKDIVLIRKDVKSGLLVMYYYDKKMPASNPVNYMVINIKDKAKIVFAESMRKRNPQIVFELFDKDSGNQDDDNNHNGE